MAGVNQLRDVPRLYKTGGNSHPLLHFPLRVSQFRGDDAPIKVCYGGSQESSLNVDPVDATEFGGPNFSGGDVYPSVWDADHPEVDYHSPEDWPTFGWPIGVPKAVRLIGGATIANVGYVPVGDTVDFAFASGTHPSVVEGRLAIALRDRIAQAYGGHVGFQYCNSEFSNLALISETPPAFIYRSPLNILDDPGTVNRTPFFGGDLLDIVIGGGQEWFYDSSEFEALRTQTTEVVNSEFNTHTITTTIGGYTAEPRFIAHKAKFIEGIAYAFPFYKRYRCVVLTPTDLCFPVLTYILTVSGPGDPDITQTWTNPAPQNRQVIGDWINGDDNLAQYGFELGPAVRHETLSQDDLMVYVMQQFGTVV